MTDDTSTYQLRWPFSAAATFVGLMWIAYGWSIWVAEGVSPSSGGMWLGSLTNEGYYVAGALRTDAVVHDHEWERLVSAIFLHIGFIHIIMNSAAILQMGRILEAFTTRGRCWLTLLFSGLCGSLTTVIWAQVTGQPNNSAGASGAGCGIGTALIVLSRGIPALTEFRKQMVTWVVVMLALGLTPMISGSGHAGGAIGGALAGLLIARRGSMRLANDSYSQNLGRLTVVMTLCFVAAVAVNAWHAPQRKADIAEIDAAVLDVFGWLDAGAVPDVHEWEAHLESLKLPSRLDYERRWLINCVRTLENAKGVKIPADVAEHVRDQLRILRGK